jgi:predicted DNA-binding transcriptional regulator YafY
MSRLPSSRRIVRHSRPPLERMMRLHNRINAGDFPNCRKMAAQLEVSAKTIQRDIDFMRDRLGLPIEYDQLHFGFYYTEPVTGFPSIEITEGELVALFVAQKALEQYKRTPFEVQLAVAFDKISGALREKISFSWSDVDSAISFRTIGSTVADLELFESLSKAVLQSFEVGFDYKKLNSKQREWRRVQPYHLACIDHQWYLFGFDLDRGQVRTFALPRMSKLRLTRRHFSRPADFSLTNVLSGSFGVFTGKGNYKIRIRFDEFAAQLVTERVWHKDQKIKPLQDGGVELTLRLDNLEEIERWVLSWGEHAQVLEPRELVTRIRSAANRLEKMYGQR